MFAGRVSQVVLNNYASPQRALSKFRRNFAEIPPLGFGRKKIDGFLFNELSTSQKLLIRQSHNQPREQL